jgi:LPS O-antigen subunit length determinant protein (WzzB/FepE family)
METESSYGAAEKRRHVQEAHTRIVAIGQPEGAQIDLLPYVEAIGERWRRIGVYTAVAVLATALIDVLLISPSYRASATIRPIATSEVESRSAGFLGGIGGGPGGGLSDLAASLSGTDETNTEEYLAILRAYRFNLDLAERHHLARELLPPPGLLHELKVKFLKSTSQPSWKLYRALQDSFDCEASPKTGNITITYIAATQEQAERILGYYIEDLRDLLRSREVNDAGSAVESLQVEANRTADAVLRSDLYDLIARQLERKKMAQVQADFAFRVLDPPAAPDKPYTPTVILDCLLMGFLTAFGYILFILLGHLRAERARDRILFGSRPDGAMRKGAVEMGAPSQSDRGF